LSSLPFTMLSPASSALAPLHSLLVFCVTIMSASFFLLFFFFYCSGDHRDLHSFPTRRSSDLFASRDQNPLPYRLATAQYGAADGDRKSTRLNSSHVSISYAVFCLKKKKKARSGVKTPRYNQ